MSLRNEILQTAEILRRDFDIYKESPVNDECNHFVQFEEKTIIPGYLKN